MSKEERNDFMSGLPTLEERPLYKTYYDSFMGNDGERLKSGLYYHGTETKDGEIIPIDTWLCSPLEVIANTEDKDGNTGKLIRLMRSNGITEDLPVRNGDVVETYRNPLIKRLADRDVKVSTNRKHHKTILNYIMTADVKDTYCYTDRTGWTETEPLAFILPDETIGNDKFKIYQPIHQYEQKGTLEDWKATIGTYSKGNPIIQLTIMASFAGALLVYTDTRGGLHFFGSSGKGKSSSLQAGASVWGNGKTYITEWRATGNGLEQRALLSNDTLLALDELSQLDAKIADSMIYALANGYVKQRAKAESGIITASQIKPWRVITLSAGEQSIKGFIKVSKQGRDQKAGQAVRFLDIPATIQPYGAFDTLNGFNTPQELAEAITHASTTYYGTSGRAFIRYLVEHNPPIKVKHKAYRDIIEKQNAPTSTEENRAIKMIALLAVAGEIAIEAGILPWDKEDPIKACQLAFKLWRKERGISGANLSKIIVVNAIKDKWLNERYLFKDNDISADVFNNQTKIIGWYKKIGAERYELLFTRTGLLELVDNQLTIDEIVKALNEIGALTKDKGKNTVKRTVKGLLSNQRLTCYAINSDVLFKWLSDNDIE